MAKESSITYPLISLVLLVAVIGWAGWQLKSGFVIPMPDLPPIPVIPPDIVPPSPLPLPDGFDFGKVNRATAAELDQVQKLEVPVLLKFGSEACGPCNSMQPHLEQFAKDAGQDVLVVELEIREDRAPFSAFRIQAMPTLVLLKSGERDRVEGALTSRQIARFVEGALNENRTTEI